MANKKTRRIKLSAAILKGCKKRKKAKGGLFKEYATKQGLERRSCALGAAWEGMGNTPSNRPLVLRHLRNMFPELYEPYPNTRENIEEKIIIWNDEQNRSRQWIAKKLQTLGL